ncbi:hypothetical protein [Actinomycetospora termitidis]|uniref:Peptide zinc metalloprotease protein n=1 Tax=Actinomycetospora termitidis TaxID=3053470 RepID=A0ABT7MEB7_9PSEU|nr:hypothetical protein [Actinomycetospora sp. Odt1-22]MDL5159008.1 hypothetical protein [Actinomycetospora sp. Odt1-22]
MIRFNDGVRWRVSKRGLVLVPPDADAMLLEHPGAAPLADLLVAGDTRDRLIGALDGAARTGTETPVPGTELIDQMLDAGVIADDAVDEQPDLDGSEEPVAPARRWTLNRSGLEFAGIEVPARFLDRYLVPVLISRVGLGVLGAVVLAGVVALVAGRPAGPTVSSHPAVDGLLGFLVVLVLAAAHELAHAVALVHYGGTPRRAGIGFYWGSVCYYVDSTDAVTLPRRARVIQALAGLAVDVVAISILAITAHLSGSVLITAVFWRLAVVGLVDLLTNAAPILELDGHWALADYLDEPDLAPRARAAFADRLRRRPSPRWLALYGGLSLAGGVVLLVGGAFVWWYAAGDLVVALFAGNVVDILVGLYVVVPFALGLLASLVGLAVETLRRGDPPASAARGAVTAA